MYGHIIDSGDGWELVTAADEYAYRELSRRVKHRIMKLECRGILRISPAEALTLCNATQFPLSDFIPYHARESGLSD